MTPCRDCAALWFVWGWNHGPRPFCQAHQFWVKSAKWFRDVWLRRYVEDVKRAEETRAAARERRLERRRQRRAALASVPNESEVK